MGNHHSHDSKGGGEQGSSGTSTPRGSQRGAGSRSGSGGDLQGIAEKNDKPPPSMKYVHKAGKCKNKHIPLSTFRQQCEKILAMLDDNVIIETYMKLFSSDDDDNTVTPDGLRSLLYTSYKLSMDHYPEGPQTCLMINKTLSAVVL
ncbi:unnamed protein product [Arctia plantaginis]|uniref:Uncharacterized protein n=1 Tax=Arctia plantaginis TaxID=874455 RepID=A0A8S1AF42_ARCPL|nr:unnamed protein product [Arctia plantaginis]